MGPLRFELKSLRPVARYPTVPMVSGETMQKQSLQPITAKKAKKMYLESKEGEVSYNSLDIYHYRLKPFVEWCETTGRDNLNTLTGRDLTEYKNWRRKDGDLNKVSLRSQLQTLSQFIKFLESIQGVQQDLHALLQIPTVGKEGAKDEKISPEKAQSILDYLSRYEYASFNHVLFSLLWTTGVRLGTARSWDIADYDRENQRLQCVHRPDSETPLKNKKDGQRLIALQPDMCEVLDEYIQNIRLDSLDDYGRNSLLATEFGRVSKNKIRHTIYKLTCPRYIGDECDCNPSKPWECDQSISPHCIRRGSITYFLSRDVPEVVVSDRMNVSTEILEKHYDRRSPEQKVEQRRGYLNNV